MCATCRWGTDSAWSDAAIYLQLADLLVRFTHGAAGWDALCSFQFLNFVSRSLHISADTQEKITGGVLLAVTKVHKVPRPAAVLHA